MHPSSPILYCRWLATAEMMLRSYALLRCARHRISLQGSVAARESSGILRYAYVHICAGARALRDGVAVEQMMLVEIAARTPPLATLSCVLAVLQRATLPESSRVRVEVTGLCCR